MQSVVEASRLAARSADELGFSDDDQQRIALAVHECVLNAVSHGNQFSNDKLVHISIRSVDSKLVIEVEDEGCGFAPEQVPDPCGDENLERDSGRGLLIIRSFMDEVDIGARSPSGTRVRMAKKIVGGGH